MTITVKYSCNLCGLKMVPVEVEARTKEEPVAHWVGETLGWALSRDHDKRSPHCHITKLTEVAIPITGAEFIGAPTVQ